METPEEPKPEPTIWRIPDDLWELLAPILEAKYPKHPFDRKRVDLRRVLDGILYKLRTGCQWNVLPKEFGDDSTVHRHFHAMCRNGVFLELWRLLLARCEELDGVDWEWQSVDTSMVKARGKSKIPDDAVGPNPTDRAKKGRNGASSSTGTAVRWA